MKVRVYLQEVNDDEFSTIQFESEVYKITDNGNFLVYIPHGTRRGDSYFEDYSFKLCLHRGGFYYVDPHMVVDVITKDGAQFKRTACELITE